MRRPITLMLCLTLLACLAPFQAAAAECGPATKIMTMERYGFVPDVQYMCGGQTVVLYNYSGSYVTFNYKDYLGRTYTVSNLRSGSYVILSAATPIYNVKTYGRYGYYLLPGEIKYGTAPDSY